MDPTAKQATIFDIVCLIRYKIKGLSDRLNVIIILRTSVFPRHFQVFALAFGSRALKFSGTVTTFCLLLVNTCVRFVALIIMAEVVGRSKVEKICFYIR